MADQNTSKSHVVRYLAIAAAVILFIVFVYLVVIGASAGQYIAVAAVFIFAVLATRLDDITDMNFGASGIAAKLERQLREAQASVSQLHAFAEAWAARSIKQIAADNRWAGLSPAEKRGEIANIVIALETIGLAKDRIETAARGADPYDDYDYFWWTMSPVYHGHEKSVQEKRDAFHDLRTSKIGNNPSADQTEVFLKANGWYSGEIAARMADWQYWKIHRSHRRLNHWESRHERGRTELELEVALKEPVSM